MSGRRRPSSVAVDTCSSKSQCSSMPAISTTRRSWISPQRPRVCGERSAVTRLRVSFWSCSCPRWSCGHLLVQPLVGALALELHLPEPALVAGQRLAQRVEQLRDRLLALGQVALGRRAGLAELRVGQGKELLVVLGQRLAPTARRTSPPGGRAPPRPAPSPRLGPAQQLELGRGHGPGRLRRRPRRPTAACSCAACCGRGGLRVGQPALGERAAPARRARAHQVPGKADRQPDGEPEDHTDDHGAKVTMGCVNFGDHSPPGPHPRGLRRPRHRGVVTLRRSR